MGTWTLWKSRKTNGKIANFQKFILNFNLVWKMEQDWEHFQFKLWTAFSSCYIYSECSTVELWRDGGDDAVRGNTITTYLLLHPMLGPPIYGSSDTINDKVHSSIASKNLPITLRAVHHRERYSPVPARGSLPTPTLSSTPHKHPTSDQTGTILVFIMTRHSIWCYNGVPKVFCVDNLFSISQPRIHQF